MIELVNVIQKIDKRTEEFLYNAVKLAMKQIAKVIYLLFPSLVAPFQLQIWNMTRVTERGFLRFMMRMLRNPSWVSRFLLNNPATIEYRYILSEDDDKYVGFYHSHSSTIEVKKHEGQWETFLHEVGHFVDDVYGFHCSQAGGREIEYRYDNYVACNGYRPYWSEISDEFYEIYLKERKYFADDLYYYEKPCEFFAQSFSEFFVNYEEFSKACPLMTKSILDMMKDMDGQKYDFN